MKIPRLIGSIGVGLLALVLVIGARPADCASPEPTDGTDHHARRLLATRCTVCHSLELIVQQRLDREHWSTTVKKMSSWGAPLSEADIDVLVAYLASRYHPDAGSFVMEQPAH